MELDSSWSFKKGGVWQKVEFEKRAEFDERRSLKKDGVSQTADLDTEMFPLIRVTLKYGTNPSEENKRGVLAHLVDCQTGVLL